MADETVLELQVRDNAESAAKGLSALVASLEKINNIGGLKLDGVAAQIERLRQTVTTAIPQDAIDRFSRLADALERLKNIGPIKVKLSNGALKSLGVENVSDQVKQTVSESQKALEPLNSDVRNNVGGAFERASSEAQNALGPLDSKIKEVESTVQEMNESAETTAASFEHLDSRFDIQSAKSKLELLQDRLEQLQTALREGIETGSFDDKKVTDYSIRIANVKDQIERLSAPAKTAQSSVEEMGQSF